MMTINFTEFQKNASALFSEVEAGKSIRVTRHGKLIAQILPISGENIDKEPSWKKRRTKLTLTGNDLSQIIIEEREPS